MSAPVEGRRAFLRSGCRHCLGLAALAGGGAWAQDLANATVPARFARPAVETEEGGLWAMMDREERRLRRSPLVMRDGELDAYLRELVCRLGGEHCADVRVHVVRTAQFNASMAPNGLMQVWSGLLLRVDNEAQLAAILGHELGHYLERHQLALMRDAKNKSAAAMFLSLFGLPGALAGLGVAASIFGFSREQEARADALGVHLMRNAGYDARHAAQVWDNLLAELKVTGGEDAGKRSPLFATHPPAGDRRDTLLKLAGEAGGKVGAEELARVVAPHRLEWLQEEIRRGQYEESLELFDRKLAQRPDDAQWLYARGEVRRLRGQPEDLPLALADLERGAAALKAPAEVFRSLGLLQKRREETVAAVAAFEKYLVLAPDAGDSGLIKTYLSELKP
jgi:predicted Zn-dependent protease